MSTIYVEKQCVPEEGVDVLVTPEMAASWRARFHYHGQRSFRKWHCDNLARMMQQGLFRPKTQVAFMKHEGDYFLTNGQHTLAALEMSGVPQVLCVTVTEANSMEEVADDFSRHDTHLTRRFGDAMAAHDIHEWLGVTVTDLHTISAACAFYASVKGEVNVRSVSMMTHDQKMEIVRRHGRMGVTSISYFTGSGNRKAFVRRAVLSCAMACTYESDKAEDFYRAMAMDDGLRQGDPRKTLLEWLKEHNTQGAGRSVANGVKTAAEHEFVKAVSVAWNAWVAGRDLKIIRVNFDARVAAFDHVGELLVRRQIASKGPSSGS